jgi:hypothetical protein
MKREVQIGLSVLAVIAVILLFLYIRTERYEAPPPPPDPAPQNTADLNPAIEELKAEILACGDDKTCVRKAMVKSMKKK